MLIEYDFSSTAESGIIVALPSPNSHSRSESSRSLPPDPPAPRGVQDDITAFSPIPTVGPSRSFTSENDQPLVSNQSTRGAFRLIRSRRSVRRPTGNSSSGKNDVGQPTSVPSVPSRRPRHITAVADYRLSSQRNQDAESARAPVLSQASERPPDRSAQPLYTHEDDYDSDMELAKALSLSLEISGSSDSSPPEIIASPPDPKSHHTRGPLRSHPHGRRQTGAIHTESSPQHQCPICLEDMTGRAKVGAPCGHTLCQTCRTKLVHSSDGRPKCHMCRMPYSA